VSKRIQTILFLLVVFIPGCGSGNDTIDPFTFETVVACSLSPNKIVNIHSNQPNFPFVSAAFEVPDGAHEMDCQAISGQDWSCLAENLQPYEYHSEGMTHYRFRITGDYYFTPDHPNYKEWDVTVGDCITNQTGVEINLSCPQNGITTADITTAFVNTAIPNYFKSKDGTAWQCILNDPNHIQCGGPLVYDEFQPVEFFNALFHSQPPQTNPGDYFALWPDCGDLSMEGVLSCVEDGGYYLQLTYSPPDWTFEYVKLGYKLDCTYTPGYITCPVPYLLPQLTPHLALIDVDVSPYEGFGKAHHAYLPIPNCQQIAIVQPGSFQLGDVGCHSGSQVFVMVKLPEDLKEPQVLSSLVVKDCNTTYQCYPLESDPYTLYCIGNKPQLNPLGCSVQVCVQPNGHEVCQNLPAAIPLDCPNEMKPPATSTNCGSFGSQSECKAAGCIWHFVTAGSPFCSNK
jgi:hypothetical protein